MFQLFKFLFFLLFFLLHPLLTFSLPFGNSSSQLCHHDEKMALLQFIDGFTIHSHFSEMYYDVRHFEPSYPKTLSWKVNRDCCLWDGVTCDSTSGHVIELDLSCSQLGGIIHPNSTLFHLSHLQSLNLAYNYLNSSHISPNFGHLYELKVLNLSHSGFIGDIPIDFGHLSLLVSLDLSIPLIKIPHFDRIIRNFTNLRQLHLNHVLINSTLPQTLSNLSSLSSLELNNCSLQGALPSTILRLPHMQSLKVGSNPDLYIDPSRFNNLSSSLQVLDFSATALSGRLPEFSLGRQLPRLRQFSASYCNLFGTIPMWIWNTTEMVVLDNNNLTGELPSALNIKELSHLTSLNLKDNFLKGTIPSWLMNLPSLKHLYLNSNQFTGKVNGQFPKDNCSLEFLDLSCNNFSLHLNMFSNCKNLRYFSLSHLSLIAGNNSTFSWPNLSILKMSSCNITEFPVFSNSQQTLYSLDLSNNRIQGEIPTWFYDVGKDSLQQLNVSFNKLTGSLNLLSWKSLQYVDLRSNSLQGLLPLPPSNTTVFLASSNKFHGEITSSICDLSQLSDLDLSNNRFTGKIPQCFEKLSRSLELLDLGSNKLHGNIPLKFRKDCNLRSIHLDTNRFEGKIPRSLTRCKRLEVLDLGKNRFNDSFPGWLHNLQELKVLVLQSNNFQGSIKEELKANKHPFPKLQILDLSRNHFCGKLPAKYIQNFKALMLDKGGGHAKYRKYIGQFDYCQDSLVLTMKGISLEFKILTILTALDFSNNNFSGGIPDSIGDLVALVTLNVSHNQLTGRIPPSLANLTSLQSLDLSSNRLEGELPPQLVRLTFLEDFNVSENKLVGPIPQSTQFSTFSRDSYEGNSGLCGDPLPQCGEGGVFDHQPATPASQQGVNDIIDIITSISLWEIILIGFGLGATLGLVVGYYLLSSKRPTWFSRKTDRLEDIMVQRLKKRARRQQRRA